MAAFAQVRRAWGIVGPRETARLVLARLRGRPSAVSTQVDGAIAGASVLEVGGPSERFQPDAWLPVYDRVGRIDNVNYAGATLWESGHTDGGDFAPTGRPLGRQWLREATNLGDLGPYDAVISSHTIEHTANPLRALREWRRVCRDGGSLVLVVPHRDGTFDHRRPLTTLDHLRQDERGDVDEADDTHAAEILALHDVDRDPGLPDPAELRRRVAANSTTRAMHHHVFSTRTALDMVEEAGWVPLSAEAAWPYDIVILARNGGEAGPVRVVSPFPSDRG